jgi:hypothetical protein
LEEALTRRLTKPAYVSKNPRPHATASMALKCARQIGYQVAGEAQAPYRLATLLTFGIGDWIHDHVQGELARAIPGFQSERSWSMGAVTGRCDGVYGDDQANRTVVEIKSMDKTGYLAALTGDGPRADHVMQADISAIALTAPRRHIVYVCKDNNAKVAVREWKSPVDVKKAEAEVARLTRIVKEVVDGRPLPRLINGMKLNPNVSAPPCMFCNYRDLCIKQGE